MSFLRVDVVSLVGCLCLFAIGCGGGSSAPQTSDLEQYVRDNPDAPKSNGEEPAGINGPEALPGAEGR